MNGAWWNPPKMTPRMRVGRRAERFVARTMRRRGFSILARNYLWKGGEIDLIARRGDLVIIMEVRYRRRETHGSAIESVTPGKQQRIIRGAQRFLQRHPELRHCKVRFDVAGVSGKGLFLTCDWVENAFVAGQQTGYESWRNYK